MSFDLAGAQSARFPRSQPACAGQLEPRSPFENHVMNSFFLYLAIAIIVSALPTSSGTFTLFSPPLRRLYVCSPGLTCTCTNCPQATTCRVSNRGACYAHVYDRKHDRDDDDYDYDDDDAYVHIVRGCLVEHTVEFHCLGDGDTSFCCTKADYCNRDWMPSANSTTTTTATTNGEFHLKKWRRYPSNAFAAPPGVTAERRFAVGLIIGIVAGCLVGFLLLVCLLLIKIRATSHRRRRRHRRLDNEGAHARRRRRSKKSSGAGTKTDLAICYRSQTHSLSSGSGAGIPLLAPRTVARHIRLVDVVGKGRFGEVWKGQWQGEWVAVKIFHSWEEQSWSREAELYKMPMLRHENVLGFKAADLNSTGAQTQLWLVLDYHPNGSLYEYLHSNVLTLSSLLVLARTTASGLAHLHTDVCGRSGKPGIAHRDLKSRNILVKADGSCAIADLGLAVCNYPDLEVCPTRLRSGTRRYMAPELLDESINRKDFDAFRRADVYSYGLILWEMTRRCCTKGIEQ